MYAVAIQGGAIAAVLVLYWHRIRQMGRGLVGHDSSGARLALSILVAFLPAAVLGLAFDDVIERYLFSPLPIAAAWAAGGGLMLAVSSRLTPGGAPLDTVSTRAAFIIGLCQCAALWPGVSRSLATILGGAMVGLSLTAAVEFSFLLGLLTLGAATAYKAVDSGAVMLQAYGGAELAAGFLLRGSRRCFPCSGWFSGSSDAHSLCSHGGAWPLPERLSGWCSHNASSEAEPTGGQESQGRSPLPCSRRRGGPQGTTRNP